jgi:hypothetical protein
MGATFASWVQKFECGIIFGGLVTAGMGFLLIVIGFMTPSSTMYEK